MCKQGHYHISALIWLEITLHSMRLGIKTQKFQSTNNYMAERRWTGKHYTPHAHLIFALQLLLLFNPTEKQTRTTAAAHRDAAKHATLGAEMCH